MKRDLLDDMARLSGCLYLSDLRMERGRPRLKSALRKINHRCYSLRDWQETIGYVTQEQPVLSSTRDGYQYLWSWLNGKGIDDGGEGKKRGILSAADF